MFNKRIFAPLVLPAVYDDVLSYEEWLAKVINRLNEINDFVNETIGDIESLVNQMVNSNLTTIRQDISSIKISLADLGEQLTELDDKIDESAKDTLKQANEYALNLYNSLGNVDAKIADAVEKAKNEAISTADTNSKEYTNKIFSQLQFKVIHELGDINRRIDDIIKEYPLIYNPTTGLMETMQNTIYNLYKAIRYYGITAMKYDDTELTAEQYDAKLLTAIQYDAEMLHLLYPELKEIFNPFTGDYQTTSQVLTDLITRLKFNSKTTTEYDGYQFTASQFDDSDFNAYTQDTNKYYTTPTEDNKNKKYRNWILLAQDNDNIASVEFLKHDISELSILTDSTDFYTIPCKSGVYLISEGMINVNITDEDNICNVTFTENGSDGHTVNQIYGITYIQDISELDR